MTQRNPGTAARPPAVVAEGNAARPRNRLLAALPRKEWALLRPHLRHHHYRFKEMVIAADTPMREVLFPETGCVSLMVTLLDGAAAEVGLAGREAMIGLPLLLGTDRSKVDVQWQSDGSALRLDAGAFRAALGTSEAFRARMLLYAMAHTMQVSQTAACNGRHALRRRLARWLLMAHDRVETDEFNMTHDLLAVMLGVRRGSISLAAASLRRDGLVRYAGGRMRILNRRGLEAAACECYAAVRQETERLLGGGHAPAVPDPGNHVR